MNRVVVTGMGVLTPIGHTVKEFWDNLVAGRSGVGKISRFDVSNYDCRIAGEVKGFNPSKVLDKKEARRADLFEQYALAATGQALADAGLDSSKINPERVGVVLGLMNAWAGGATLLNSPLAPLLQREGDHFT